MSNAEQSKTNLLIELVKSAKRIAYQSRRCAVFDLMITLGVQELELCVETRDDYFDGPEPEYHVKIKKKTSKKSNKALATQFEEFCLEIDGDYLVDQGACEYFNTAINDFKFSKEELTKALESHKLLVAMLDIA
jgi:hypothetical protein